MSPRSVKVYTDCGRMVLRSERRVSAEEAAEVDMHIAELRTLFGTGILGVPTYEGHTLVPLNRIHVIDIGKDTLDINSETE